MYSENRHQQLSWENGDSHHLIRFRVDIARSRKTKENIVVKWWLSLFYPIFEHYKYPIVSTDNKSAEIVTKEVERIICA